MKRSPIKSKRDTPRRNLGRVQHVRIKPEAKVAPTGREKRHCTRVRLLACLVPGCAETSTLHHIMVHPEKIRRRDHRFVVPLCGFHHQDQKWGVHGLGTEFKFLREYGIDLAAEASRLWEESCKE